jgi:DNA-binding PadR family transcriptional regulator
LLPSTSHYRCTAGEVNRWKQRIREISNDLLQVEEGSLYPALQRLLKARLVKAEWSVSATNRRVRIYRITPAGRKHLAAQVSSFEQMLEGISLVQNLVGMQVGPFTMLDEGIERALDLIQSTAAVETIFPYTHAYGGSVNKGLENLAKDHSVPPRDQSKRNLPNVWVRHNEQYFKDTTLRHPRILEAGPRNITNYIAVRTVNVNGQPTGSACRANPNYRAFYAATVEDLFRSYEFDGFQWGGERASPLAEIIAGRFAQAAGVNQATCFCEYCIARGKAAGIDVEGARPDDELCRHGTAFGLSQGRRLSRRVPGTHACLVRPGPAERAE